MIHIDWARLYAEYDCLAIGIPFTNDQLIQIKDLGIPEKIELVKKWREELEKGEDKPEAKEAKKAEAEAKKLAKEEAKKAEAETQETQETQEVVANASKNQKK